MRIRSRVIKPTFNLGICCVFIIQSSMATAAPAQKSAVKNTPAQFEDPHVRSTHEHARSLAKQQVNQLLMQAILKSYNTTFIDDPNGAKTIEIQSRLRNFNEIHSRLDLLSHDQQEFDNYSNDVLVQIVRDFRTAMIELKNEKMFLKDYQVTASSIRNQLVHTYSNMKSNMSTYCKEGVAFSPHSEILPVMKPIMPAFEIDVKARASFDTKFGNRKMDENPYEFSGKTYSTSEALAMLTVLDAVATSLAATAISQQAVFTSTAFSGLTAAQQGASVVIGLGASLAIAAAVYLSKLDELRKQKEDFIHDASKQYDQIARSNDFNTYFKEECTKAFTVLNSMDPSDVAYSNPSKDSKEHLENNWQEVQKFISSYIEVSKAYHAKYAELEKSLPQTPSEEDKRIFGQKISQAPETKSYEEYGKKLDSATLSRYFKIIIIKSIQDGFSYADRMDKMIEGDLKKVDEKKLEARYRSLREFVIHKKYAEEIAKNTSSYFDEQSAFLKFRDLYQELTALMLKKTEHLVTISLSQQDKISLEIAFNTWSAKALDLLTQYPGLTGISGLIDQAKYFQAVEATPLLR